ncbi:hypothetical protein CRG98_011303 [Punica granatum]|uniref:Uncharacterized protein n=1 Tax=Punica granatum TaxID=22663 RepID=A0A2I0KII5_PUNGR|nr:hypothetical protein CRG98_011303 [Punica granatum]
MSAVGAIELSGDCLTSIHTPDPSGLPHRHCLEQGGELGLDPIPHLGCARSVYVAVLDPPRDTGKAEERRKNGFEKSVLSPGTNRPESVKSGQLAVQLVGAVPVDWGGLFARDRLRWIPKRLRITPALVS